VIEELRVQWYSASAVTIVEVQQLTAVIVPFVALPLLELYYLRSIPLDQVIFYKGSHPVSFQSFLCTVQYTLYFLARSEDFI
jgi:hypothetical protein